jgi:hypothetical protein
VTLLHFTKANASAERECPGGDGSSFKHTLDFSAIEKLNVLCASIYQRFMFPEMTMTSDFSSKSLISQPIIYTVYSKVIMILFVKRVRCNFDSLVFSLSA